MKQSILITLLLLFHSNIFASGNIEKYMFMNSMNYPYNVKADIDKSFYVDFDEGISNGFIENKELTDEQRAIMIPFIEKLNTIPFSDSFAELKNQKGVVAFSIGHVYIFKSTPEYVSIVVDIWFYLNTDEGLCGAEYNEEYNFWRFFNRAQFSMDDYRLLGFMH